MRVISGSAGGRKLKTPDDNQTRPTADRVKESIFNIIQFDIEGRRVLDLFAGSGQLGIEALSRGACSCTFVDNSPAARALIAKNVESTALMGATVLLNDYKAFLKSCTEQFDLIFLDPPYDDIHLQKAITYIEKFDILSKGGIIVAEGAQDVLLPDAQGDIVKLKEYRYGIAKVTVFTRKV